MHSSSSLTSEILSCSLLGKLLYEPPVRERIHVLDFGNVFNLDLSREDDCDVAGGIELIHAWSAYTWRNNPEEAFEAIQSDYQRLFVGPEKILAPPWESVWRSEKRLMFQEQTLEVRERYRRYGLEIHNMYHEPDDHIKLGLAFVACLAKLGTEMYDILDFESYQRLLNEKNIFFAQHLQSWAPKWCEAVLNHAKTDYYRGIAQLVRGTIEAMEEMESLSKADG